MGIAMGAFLAPFDSMNGLKVAENATTKETAVATLHQTKTKALSMGRTFAVHLFALALSLPPLCLPQLAALRRRACLTSTNGWSPWSTRRGPLSPRSHPSRASHPTAPSCWSPMDRKRLCILSGVCFFWGGGGWVGRIVYFFECMCAGPGGHLRRDRMHHRKIPRKVRHQERGICRMLHWGCAGAIRRGDGHSWWVWAVCPLVRGD
jgi:hypothetical protein